MYSDEVISHVQSEQVSPACVLSDSFTAAHHREGTRQDFGNWRPQLSDTNHAPCEDGFEKDKLPRCTEKSSNHAFKNEHESKVPKEMMGPLNQRQLRQPSSGKVPKEMMGPMRQLAQPSPGKSFSEQTQKSEDGRRAINVRRPQSCTSKFSRSSKRPSKNSLTSLRMPATRDFERDGYLTDSPDEEITFITCRETIGRSSATLATELNHQRSHGSPVDRWSKQSFDRCSRKNMRHSRRGDEPESDVSSVRGFDSIESDSAGLYDPSLSEDLDGSEKYCSDPLAANGRFSLSEAEMSKSDTKASIDRSVKRSVCYRGRRIPGHKPQSRQAYVHPKGATAIECYTKAMKDSKQREAMLSGLVDDGSQEHVEFYDAKESGEDLVFGGTKTIPQPQGQKYFAVSRIDPTKGYRSNFLIQEMNDEDNQRREQMKQDGGTGRLGLNGARTQSCEGKHSEIGIQEPHLGNTIWYDVERFQPIQSPRRISRHRSYRNPLAADNRGYHNTRKGSESPPQMRRKYDPKVGREANRQNDGSPHRTKRNRSPTKLDWHTYVSLKERKREISLLKERARQLAAHKRASHPYLKGEESFSSPVDCFWNSRILESPDVENLARNSQGHGRSFRSKEGRVRHRKAPRASWSFDSDHSPVAYRGAVRMMPYRRRALSKSECEDRARTLGSSVDGGYPVRCKKESPTAKIPIGDTALKPLAMNSTDEDLKESLKKAMEIAQQSLTAAAKVSKALNLVMTSSCLSNESGSLYGSSTDPRSPKMLDFEARPPKQILRWAQAQKSPPPSSRNTDLSCVSSHRPVSRNPPSPVSLTRASPTVGTSLEEPLFIGRSNDVSIRSEGRSRSTEGRRSRSTITDRDRVLNIVPNYQLLGNKTDGSETSAPLVSIYIGGSGMQQQPQEVARILSSHLHQNYSQPSGIHDSSNYLQPVRGQITCNRKEPSTKSCLLEGPRRFTDMKKGDCFSFYPAREQTVCVNMVTAQEVRHETAPASKLSDDSSNSQVFESTMENLESKVDPSNYGEGKSKSKKNTTRPDHKNSFLENNKHQDIPTHEDGSRRPEMCSTPSQDSSFTEERLDPPHVIEKIAAKRYRKSVQTKETHHSKKPKRDNMAPGLEFLPPPDSRSAVMSAAINYLVANPMNFSPTSPLFGNLSPPFAKSILHPDQISPPNSVYSSASEFTQGNDQAPPSGLSPCPLSPGSCVDPSGYQSDGSAVDPPKWGFERNSNANKSRQRLQRLKTQGKA